MYGNNPDPTSSVFITYNLDFFPRFDATSEVFSVLQPELGFKQKHRVFFACTAKLSWFSLLAWKDVATG